MDLVPGESAVSDWHGEGWKRKIGVSDADEHRWVQGARGGFGRMSRDEKVALLSRTPLFENIDAAHLRVLVYAADHARFAPGDYLVREGGEEAAGFLVVDGEAEAWSDEDPAMRLRITRGAFIGEGAMIAGLAHRLNVRAVTEVEALRITRKLFMRVCHEFPELGRMVMSNYARRMASISSALHTLLP